MKTDNKIKYAINLLFFLYFMILLEERIMSIVWTFIKGVNIFNDGFIGFVYITIFISIIGFFILLILKNRNAIKALYSIDDESIEKIDFKQLCIASGVLLLSGMVHSEYSVPVIQFISYGLLIIAIVLQAIINNKNSNNKLILYISLIYLICYSMAIPVTYRSSLSYHVLFHIIEGFTSYFLVMSFTCLMIFVFMGKENLFHPAHFITALVLDALIIGLYWPEVINYFVLIFISLTTILFVAGRIVICITNKKTH